MIPETAYVKLGWLLGHKYSLEKIKKLMTENIAGEISARSLV
jgi:glutamyl-tRNA(Gln) amidotransferase subunit D